MHFSTLLPQKMSFGRVLVLIFLASGCSAPSHHSPSPTPKALDSSRSLREFLAYPDNVPPESSSKNFASNGTVINRGGAKGMTAISGQGPRDGVGVLKSIAPKSPLSALDEERPWTSKEEMRQWPQNFSLEKVRTFLRKKQWAKASTYINTAIEKNTRLASLHMINGLVYEEVAHHTGSSNQCQSLATVAYRAAYNLNPCGDIAYYLGSSCLRERNYKEAQEYLADALSFEPKNLRTLYALAYSAYYAGNMTVAQLAVRKSLQLEPNNPALLRAAAIIFAACGEKDKGLAHLARYEATDGAQASDVAYLRGRIGQLFSHAGQWRQAALDEGAAEGLANRQSSDLQNFLSTSQAAIAANAEEKDSKLALVFDLNLLRFSETRSRQEGQNIFESLAVNLRLFGDAFKTLQSVNNVPSPSTWSRNLGFTLDQVALTYLMNFMNVNSQVIEVVARPTIYALSGKASFFAQGSQLQGAANSPVGGGTLTTVDAGTKIEIIVQKVYPDGTVILKVTVTGNLFNSVPNTRAGISDQIISLTGSTVETTVKVKLGETVMISGIDSVTKTRSVSGVPGLMDVPGLSLITSSRSNSLDHRTTVYFLTPRALDPAMSFPSAQCVRSALKLRQSGVFLDLSMPNAILIAENIHHLLRPNDMILPDYAHAPDFLSSTF